MFCLKTDLKKKKLAFDFCRFCVVIRFFIPGHNDQWPPNSKDFLSQTLSITFIFPVLILEKEPVFCILNVQSKTRGTTGTIFITFLVWCGHWLGIEPGTSRTRSQYYTSRLSRRRLKRDNSIQIWMLVLYKKR